MTTEISKLDNRGRVSTTLYYNNVWLQNQGNFRSNKSNSGVIYYSVLYRLTGKIY